MQRESAALLGAAVSDVQVGVQNTGSTDRPGLEGRVLKVPPPRTTRADRPRLGFSHADPKKKTQTNLEAEMGLLGQKQCWAELCCLLVMSCWDENWRELSGLLFLASGEWELALALGRESVSGPGRYRVASNQLAGRQAVQYGVRIGAVQFRQGHLLRVKMLSSWMMVGSVTQPAIFLLQHSTMVGSLHADLQFGDSIGLNSCDPDFTHRITADIHLR